MAGLPRLTYLTLEGGASSHPPPGFSMRGAGRTLASRTPYIDQDAVRRLAALTRLRLLYLGGYELVVRPVLLQGLGTKLYTGRERVLSPAEAQAEAEAEEAQAAVMRARQEEQYRTQVAAAIQALLESVAQLQVRVRACMRVCVCVWVGGWVGGWGVGIWEHKGKKYECI